MKEGVQKIQNRKDPELEERNLKPGMGNVGSFN